MEAKFCICRHCGNLVMAVHDAGVPMVCCGEQMEVLTPNTVEASGEKHLPVITVKDGTVHVSVGAVGHPMAEDHSIQWIWLCTKRGGQLANLRPGTAPEAAFCLVDDRAIAAYAWCNLHGLWMAEVK